MKKIFIILFLLVGVKSIAQKIYTDFSVGYNFILGEQNLTSFNYNNYFGIYNPSLHQKVDVSLGKGMTVEFGVGYNSKKNYSYELNTSYLFGTTISSKSEFGSLNVMTRSISAKMLRLNPSIVFNGNQSKVIPFMRIGVIMGIGSINLIQRDNIGDTLIVLYDNKFYGGWSFGMNAGLGINFKLTKSFSSFIEVNFVSMSYAPTYGEVIEYNYQGEDLLDELDLAQREFLFLDEIESSGYDPDTPTKMLKHSYPFGSFGLKFGFRIYLWNNDDKNVID